MNRQRNLRPRNLSSRFNRGGKDVFAHDGVDRGHRAFDYVLLDRSALEFNGRIVLDRANGLVGIDVHSFVGREKHGTGTEIRFGDCRSVFDRADRVQEFVGFAAQVVAGFPASPRCAGDFPSHRSGRRTPEHSQSRFSGTIRRMSRCPQALVPQKRFSLT